jgi:hypothetical protein
MVYDHLVRYVLRGPQMVTSKIRAWALMALWAGLVPTGSACYVEAVPPPVVAEGYEPQFYDGYVVYYDAVGRPFYYEGGAVVWVPATSPFYIGLVSHWRGHRAEYARWHEHYGARYRGYRDNGRRR